MGTSFNSREEVPPGTEVLNASFALVFTSQTSLWKTKDLELRDEVWSKKDIHLAEEVQIRGYLWRLDRENSMGSAERYS